MSQNHSDTSSSSGSSAKRDKREAAKKVRQEESPVVPSASDIDSAGNRMQGEAQAAVLKTPAAQKDSYPVLQEDISVKKDSRPVYQGDISTVVPQGVPGSLRLRGLEVLEKQLVPAAKEQVFILSQIVEVPILQSIL